MIESITVDVGESWLGVLADGHDDGFEHLLVDHGLPGIVVFASPRARLNQPPRIYVRERLYEDSDFEDNTDTFFDGDSVPNEENDSGEFSNAEKNDGSETDAETTEALAFQCLNQLEQVKRLKKKLCNSLKNKESLHPTSSGCLEKVLLHRSQVVLLDVLIFSARDAMKNLVVAMDPGSRIMVCMMEFEIRVLIFEEMPEFCFGRNLLFLIEIENRVLTLADMPDFSLVENLETFAMTNI
ncbi:hypothetical protein EJB05_40672, partial [Eragrostis curvula]